MGNGEAGYDAGRGVGIVGDVEAAAYKVGIRYLFRLPVREYMMFFSTVPFATCDEHAFALDVNFHKKLFVSQVWVVKFPDFSGGGFQAKGVGCFVLM
ncbi:MAG: hypothetical protein ACSHX7_08645 [Luteolibacter sp.]